MRYNLHLTQANLLKINGLKQLTRLPGSDQNEPASRREKSPALLLQTASRHMGSLVTDTCRHSGPSSLVGAIKKLGSPMCWSASLELKRVRRLSAQFLWRKRPWASLHGNPRPTRKSSKPWRRKATLRLSERL